ncbi:MAG TPA: histidine phosphatase family protein [Woeseiaceae bacterium]|nr:histidine phosphatase family protein [Woeseiaceae bacterium]
MTTFYLVRHAEKDGPDDLLSGRAPGRGLSAAGHRQAGQLADALAHEPIGRVISSPLQRACETALPLARRLDVEAEQSEALGDIDYGAWTDRTAESLAGDPEWRRFHAFRSAQRIPEGELLIDVQARFVREMLRLRLEVPEGGIALVSHSDPIKLAIAHFAGVPLDLFSRFEIDSASLSILVLTGDSVRIVGINRLLA